MIYNNLIYNNKIINSFKQSIKSNRISNSFLFYGYNGVGKIGHALEFSGAILCKESINNTACGNCISCKKIKINQHESIKYIYPIPAKISAASNKQIEKNKQNLTDIAKNPYIDFYNNTANNILINSIREIKKEIILSTINNNYQIYIILEAEKLCFPKQESANALLKILEEPNKKYIFILITSEYSKIIDTIKSRCTQIYFPKLKLKDINRYLIDTLHMSNNESKEISTISNGNMILANLLFQNYRVLIIELSEILDNMWNSNINKLHQYFNKLKNDNNKNVLLNLLEVFFMDIISIMNGNNIIKLSSKLTLMYSFIKKFPNANWEKIIESIQIYTNDLNVYPSLLSLSFTIEVNRSLRGKLIRHSSKKYLQL